MSIDAIFDACAVRAQTITGLKKVYTVTGTAQDDGTVLAIPPSFDDTPVGALMPITGELRAGNTEVFLHEAELQIWMLAVDSNPLGVMVFIERLRVHYRSDLDVNGQATRLLFKGYRPLRYEAHANGQNYIVLPCPLEILELHFSHSYAV